MLLKATMLIGAVALAGAGLARFWLLAEAPAGRAAGRQAAVGGSSRTVRVLALSGLIVVLVASVADVRAALLNVIPTADGALILSYALTSGHGQAVQVRLTLALCLAGLALLPADRRGAAPAFLAGSLGLFGSFSVISHGAVMGGWLPLVTDLVHFASAGLWAGGVFALVLTGPWGDAARPWLIDAVGKLSRLGLAAVVLLALTGTLSALVHAGEPARFLASPYAAALAVKLAVVAVTVGLAAVNRFALLPRLLAGGSLGPMRTALRVETLLLLGVLVATGWLTTTAVPHGSDVSVEPLENAGRLLDHLLR